MQLPIPLHEVLKPKPDFSVSERINELHDLGVNVGAPKAPTESRLLHSLAKNLPRRSLIGGLEYAVSLPYGSSREQTVNATVELLYLAEADDPDKAALFVYELPVLNPNYIPT